jgi:hypothetical protein
VVFEFREYYLRGHPIALRESVLLRSSPIKLFFIGVIMVREIKFGTVSWIAADQCPLWFSGKAALLEPGWVPKTYMGLAATSNDAPGKSIDFKAYQKAKDFRAMNFCQLKVDFDENGSAVNSVSVVDSIQDPGWTPAFRVRKFPATALRFWDSNIWGFTAFAGEASPLSAVTPQAAHTNSILTIPKGEVVLADALIKFRAGKHTDDIGVNDVGAPFHVPWVWCEMAVTYAGSGKFKYYGRGSCFPSHAWYIDNQQVKTIAEIGDSSFPSSLVCTDPMFPELDAMGVSTRVCIENPLSINVSALNLYKVLNKGAAGSGTQTALSADKGRSGKVTGHPNTVEAGTAVSGDIA